MKQSLHSQARTQMWLAHLGAVCVTGALLCAAAALAAVVAQRLAALF